MMTPGRLIQCLLLLFAVTLPLPALAEEPVHGLVQVNYVADRPEAGGAAGDADGYALVAGYLLTPDLVGFGEYEHIPHPLLASRAGDSVEDDYEAGLKLEHPIDSTPLKWVSALAYEVEHDAAASGNSRERGYDFVQGLRIVVNPSLELITDLHHESVGGSSNKLVLGFVQGFGSRYAIEGEAEHSRNAGRFTNEYLLGIRFYY